MSDDTKLLIAGAIAVVIISLIAWRLIEILKTPRPKNHRDDTTSRGGWNGGWR